MSARKSESEKDRAEQGVSKRIEAVFLAWLLAVCAADAAGTETQSIIIDSKSHRLTVRAADSAIVLESPVGLGRGGCGKKKTMSDFITPLGKFRVDIVLSEDSNFNSIENSLLKRFSKHRDLLESKEGLKRLFLEMNSLDFNGDGKPDRAYGIGYIGLDSQDACTGPKLSKLNSRTYWLSIALHGTPDEANIGKSRSGGCVQIPEWALKRLIKERLVAVGSEIIVK